MSDIIKRTLTWCLLGITGLACAYLPVYVTSMCLLAVLGWILVVEWPPLLAALTHKYPNLPKITVTFLYPTIPFLFMIAINNQQQRWLLLLFFVMVFANDTGGYVIGLLFGKHKLCSLSPKKTWEGAFGGILFSLIASYALFRFHGVPLQLAFFTLFVLIISVCAIIGDLFESYLKRIANVKDSGTVLPGHGGLLDRFDSSMFSSIVFYFLITQSHFFTFL